MSLNGRQRGESATGSEYRMNYGGKDERDDDQQALRSAPHPVPMCRQSSRDCTYFLRDVRPGVSNSRNVLIVWPSADRAEPNRNTRCVPLAACRLRSSVVLIEGFARMRCVHRSHRSASEISGNVPSVALVPWYSLISGVASSQLRDTTWRLDSVSPCCSLTDPRGVRTT